MKKESNKNIKAVNCSNGHVSTPNGRADDEGGGGSASSPRVSYAAAARKALSPQANNTSPQFPQSTGVALKHWYTVNLMNLVVTLNF